MIIPDWLWTQLYFHAQVISQWLALTLGLEIVKRRSAKKLLEEIERLSDK